MYLRSWFSGSFPFLSNAFFWDSYFVLTYSTLHRAKNTEFEIEWSQKASKHLFYLPHAGQFCRFYSLCSDLHQLFQTAAIFLDGHLLHIYLKDKHKEPFSVIKYCNDYNNHRSKQTATFSHCNPQRSRLNIFFTLGIVSES